MVLFLGVHGFVKVFFLMVTPTVHGSSWAIDGPGIESELNLFNPLCRPEIEPTPLHWPSHCSQVFGVFFFLSFFFFFFCFFMAAPAAYGGFQARGQTRAGRSWPRAQPQQCQIWAPSATYITAHGNARSLTHCEWGQGSNLHPHGF